MDRTNGANFDPNAFGSGKHGYRTTAPFTAAHPDAMNAIQEEIARAIEGFGVALNPASYVQLQTILTTLLNAAGGSSTLQLSSSTPVFATQNTAHDHVGSGSNKWKLLLQGKLHDNTFVRFYVGDGTGGAGGRWILTWNAVWDVSSGGQAWSKDDTGQVSYALWANANGLNWFEKATGAGTWSSGWTAGAGNVSIGGDLSVGDDLTVSGDAAVGGDFAVSGTAAIPTVSGNVSVAGEITTGSHINSGGSVYTGTGGQVVSDTHVTAGGDVIAGDDVFAGDAFRYTSPPTRTDPIALARASGDVDEIGSNGTGGVAPGTGDAIHWPIHLPVGAQIADVQVILDQGGASPSTFRVLRYNASDWSASPAGLPTRTAEASAASGTSTGTKTITLNVNETVAAGDDWFLHWEPGQTSDRVFAARLLNWIDAGPRNTP